MELESIDGNIIGIYGREKEDLSIYDNLTVEQIIKKKCDDAMRMVNLDSSFKQTFFKDLSSMNKNKVILASKLQDKIIRLYDFSKGMTKKELDFFRRLFKKIVTYGKRIFLYTMDVELFVNLVDRICIVKEEQVIYDTDDLFDPMLYKYIDKPRIVEFTCKCRELGINLNEYNDINELIKAIYRIKS